MRHTGGNQSLSGKLYRTLLVEAAALQHHEIRSPQAAAVEFHPLVVVVEVTSHRFLIAWIAQRLPGTVTVGGYSGEVEQCVEYACGG